MKNKFNLIIVAVILIVGVLFYFFAGNKTKSNNEAMKVDKDGKHLNDYTLEERQGFTSSQWKMFLTPIEYSILREAGTETPFTGELLHNDKKGVYVTADCGEVVFSSEQKYDSDTGWPSFWAPIKDGAVELKSDVSLGEVRIEVLSPKCKSHLGHVFDDGPAPTGKRYCINSVALKFIPEN